MKLFSKMRITHKISALMIGLVAGFILIGVTYYVQVNKSESARLIEKDAFIYQQKLTELKQLELNLKFQTEQIEALSPSAASDQIKNLKTSAKQLSQETLSLTPSGSHTSKINKFNEAVTGYNQLLEEKVNALSKLRDQESANIRNELDSELSTIENTLKNYFPNEIGTEFSLLRTQKNNLLGNPSEVNKSTFISSFERLIESIESLEASNIPPLLKVETQQSIEVVAVRTISLIDELNTLNQKIETKQAELEILVDTLIAEAGTLLAASVENAESIKQATQAAVTAIIFFVAMGTAVGIYLIYKSIVFPMAHMQSVIGRINRGKTKARVKILSNDELADLGIAFNKLFDERIQQLEESSKENEKFNNSIISLIQALGAIAKKDLTVKVPVSSDITGTVSDAVNLLTSETARTLFEVKNISTEVNDASEILQDQSTRVMQFAENERRQIIATSKALKVLAFAMTEVAEQSESADKSASEAIRSTQSAKKAVVETVAGIRTIRETISETEKRTKRLGDRSQEISGIVNLINTIAERTHILALNASMHAASAGEAGKGFAVVAEEVQRLAESARQSTDEISAMVNNMRVETSDTVNIMNKLISQVAEGSKLAEQAGREMAITEQSTRELVTTVQQISQQAIQQAAVANRVKDRATIIRNFTDKTEKQIQEQNTYTDNLRQYARTLVERVNVFKLPQDTKATQEKNASNINPLKSVS